ncbi:MAG: DUF3048 domain-containing protein [Lachnospiraceae bacterium]|nr:DUF3048 domain-containing protein [Lachnospiraceae bacterium]
MKKRNLGILAAGLIVSALASACTTGGDTGTGDGGDGKVVELVPQDGTANVKNGDGGQESTGDEEYVEPEEEEVIPDGMYHSELTNEFISLDIKDQRPIAVMVDNEITALPHFGTSDADIVYEMLNSTANGRITRLMCVMKDWGSIEQFGSIRSTRPTNVMIAAEYNAILCHDGGPYYINEYLAKPYSNNLSSGFGRFPNGKSQEYTEYITYDSYTNPTTGKFYDGLKTRIERAHYSETYNEHYPGPHWNFNRTEQNLSDSHSDAFDATFVDLSSCFPHNHSQLKYNEEIGKYEYYEYDKIYEDAGKNNAHLTFENVILQKCSFSQLDDHGYLIYNILVGQPWDGYLLQNGEAIPIQWQKIGQSDRTVFSYMDGSFINLNTGKTYIAIVPDDSWSKMVIQ